MISFFGIVIDNLGDSVQLDPTILRILRIFRIFRILRAFRIFKSLKSLQELVTRVTCSTAASTSTFYTPQNPSPKPHALNPNPNPETLSLSLPPPSFPPSVLPPGSHHWEIAAIYGQPRILPPPLLFHLVRPRCHSLRSHVQGRGRVVRACSSRRPMHPREPRHGLALPGQRL